MRTDIAGLAVIALLGATAYLLFAPINSVPVTTIACVIGAGFPNGLANCSGPWREHFWLSLTTLAAAIWLIWRVRRRPG